MQRRVRASAFLRRLSIQSALTAVFALAALLAADAGALAGTSETYVYDARGRLAQVLAADGSEITGYYYDAAGNRTSSGPTAGAPQGTFLKVTSSHSSPGATGDVASITVKNSSADTTITGISAVCSPCGSYVPQAATAGNPNPAPAFQLHWKAMTTGATSLAPGASATWQWKAMASGMYQITVQFTGSATNSPWTQTF